MSKTNWRPERIPKGAVVYRAINKINLVDKVNLIDPDPAAFDLLKDERGLSVYWDEHVRIVQDIYLHLRLSAKKSSYDPKTKKPKAGAYRFKEPADYKVYQIRWKGLQRRPDLFKRILHSPENTPIPFNEGFPSNRSHAEILYNTRENMTAIRGLFLDHMEVRRMHSPQGIEKRASGHNRQPFI